MGIVADGGADGKGIVADGGADGKGIVAAAEWPG